jgi:hypothetical protein
MAIIKSNLTINTGNVAGDLSGTLQAASVVGLRGRAIDDAAPSGDQFYIWDASANEFRWSGSLGNEYLTLACPDGVTRRVRLLTPP